MLDRQEWLSKYTRLSDVVLIGYLVAGILLIVAGLIQKHVLNSNNSNSSFIFAFIAFFVLLILMPIFSLL